MSEISVYNAQGKTVEKVKLSKKVFNISINVGLLHEAVVYYLANRRSANAHTKTRGEVRGGGKKPWRQKGTGRARHGSSRSPIWRGGGITFGPRNTRNYTKKMNTKAQQKAVSMALAEKLKNNKFLVVDTLEIKEGKTKTLTTLLKNLPELRSTLMVTGANHAGLLKASKNVSRVDTTSPQSINAYDILSHDGVIVSKDALEKIEKRLTKI